ncbi:DNA polymerase III subunit gamma/tau [Aminivibrio sp.]|jgi:DNA polymerase-3 subunit gamma/tau|uniref:DNA polymerase III subunit gamma/tau n=1 Tax=Aminivibrio sp. TaxID=1872489 RepID=UPI001A3EE6D1|nr:DNA polymerase III subunit gamma/tau [Aminivibrio sp.]MBL3538860.1 DNA polymerase III subunit gamma/tau [Aminivibrio sp.]
MTISLYRRYRPRTFDEVAGQDMAVDVLKKALQRDQVGHAYLFSGPRGCGKTSLARLLAKALNCENLKDGYEPCGECGSCLSITAGESLDVVEIDGASNNGVEEIRELKSHVSLSPFSSRWKVYIIDEVHMLSISAFNALLKTLEEPPSFVAFILATTEPSKVPVTIRSRCQHIPFRRITPQDIRARLVEVAERENVPWEEDAVREIARQSDGALRDALSMMEQALSLGGGELSAVAVDRLLGGGTMSDLEQWVASAGEDSVRPFLLLEEMFLRGASPLRVVEGLFILFRNLWVFRKWGKDVLASLALSAGETAFLEAEGPKWTTDELSGMMLFCSRLIPQVRAGLRSDVLSGLLAARILESRRTLPPEERAAPSREGGEPRPRGQEPPKQFVPVPSTPAGSSSSGASPSERFRRKDPEPPAEKENTAAGTAAGSGEPVPLLPENWSGFEKMLFGRDLLLYSALAGTSVSMEDRTIAVIFPGESAYCFEVLSIERNAYSLASRVAEYFGEDVSVVLKLGDREKICAGGGNGAGDGVEWQNPGPTIPLFRIPRDEDDSPGDESEKAPAPAPGRSLPPVSPGSEPEEGEIPFEGLVNEVLKWGGGEVVLVKRDDREGDIPEEIVPPGE